MPYSRTPPAPSVCQCACLRIAHRGGQACRDCDCTKFRPQGRLIHRDEVTFVDYGPDPAGLGQVVSAERQEEAR